MTSPGEYRICLQVRLEQVLVKKKENRSDTVRGFDKMTTSIFDSRTWYVQYEKGLNGSFAGFIL